MAVSVAVPSKFLSLVFLLLSLSASWFLTAYAQTNPIAAASRPFFCFNERFYRKCGKEYRLDQRGYVNVPSYATDDYCQGPCLEETQNLLNCVDSMFPSFLFFNRASVPDIRNTLRAGCSYTTQRGIFNVGDYIGSEINSSNKLPTSVSFYASIMLAVITCFFLLK